MSLVVVVEGDTDLPVARKLARDAKLSIGHEIDAIGKQNIDVSLREWNAAAKGSPWLVLRDLDDDAACAPAFVRGVKLKPSRWMCLRIAVRALEAWLLADASALARFLDVEERWIPHDPDREPNPKTALVTVARKSRRAGIRTAMVPVPGFSTKVGPLYESSIIEFGERHWSLARACGRSDSLRRAREALRRLSAEWRNVVGGPPH